MDFYSEFVLSCDFKSISALGGKEPDDSGWMWPVDATDRSGTTERLLKRNRRIIKMELDRLAEFDKQLAELRNKG